MSEIEALRQELAEARRQQVAMAEALEAVALSTYDRDEMLRRLLRTAGSLCGAENGGIWLVQGDHLVGAVRMSGDPDEEAFLKEFSLPLTMTSSLNIRCLLSGEIIQVQDTHDGTLKNTALRDRFKFGSALTVPMRLNGAGIGVFALSRNRPSIFTDPQIAAVRSFAAQAVIAIANAQRMEELKRQRGDLNAALEQQTATAETLKTLSRSAFDLDAVLNTLVQSAMSLCNANAGGLVVRDGGEFRMRALRGHIPENAARIEDRVYKPGRYNVAPRVLLSGAVEMISDATLDPEFEYPGPVANRSFLGVPLLQDQQFIGVFVLNKREPGGFTERQIELVKTYADQAVIAIGNVKLFKDLEARTAELNEALGQQTATAETLKTLSRSVFDLDAVLNTLLESAVRLCNGEIGGLVVRANGEYRMRATVGFDRALQHWAREKVFTPDRSTVVSRVLLSGAVEMVVDLQADPDIIDRGLMAARSIVGVPLRRGGEIEGVFVLSKLEPIGFTEREIELVNTYADQAVIAIGNVQLFKDLEQRTTELRDALEQQTATAETLKTLSRSAFDLDAVLNTLVASAAALCGADSGSLTLMIDGEYRMRAPIGFNRVAQEAFEKHVFTPGRGLVVSRALFSGEVEHVADSFEDPELMAGLLPGTGMGLRTLLGVPLLRDGAVIGAFLLRREQPGGFTERQIELVKTFADQAVIAIGNAQLFKDLEARTTELNRSLEELRATQDRLIQSEKLASLGQLTAGVAHEIKNPLNFVNNFSKLSVELMEELGAALRSAELPERLKDEVEDLSQALTDSMTKIHHHGQRADSIVKNMLLHARQDGGERRAVDLNALIEESLNLAYHGARAERRGFNIELLRDLDPAVGQVTVHPQGFTRVLLNLFSNGFYAACARAGEPGFTPLLRVSTRGLKDQLEIRVRDNGLGVPEAIRDKLFTPFFTTKPAGEGTGPGLSLSYEIIVKQHGGSLSFESEAGAFTEFKIILPRLA